jgi:hypothetical protein
VVTGPETLSIWSQEKDTLLNYQHRQLWIILVIDIKKETV